MKQNAKKERLARFSDQIGRARICEALDVGYTALGNAISRGNFPASWFVVLSRLSDEAGVDCPPEMFNMRRAC